MTWTVLIAFDYTPDGTTGPVHVEPEDTVTEEQCNPDRAAIFVSLGLLVED
jgi:hypothetical protein